MRKLTAKYVGTQKDIESFLQFLNKHFSLLIIGSIKPNDRDNLRHCFVDIDLNSGREKQ